MLTAVVVALFTKLPVSASITASSLPPDAATLSAALPALTIDFVTAGLFTTLLTAFVISGVATFIPVLIKAFVIAASGSCPEAMLIAAFATPAPTALAPAPATIIPFSISDAVIAAPAVTAAIGKSTGDHTWSAFVTMSDKLAGVLAFFCAAAVSFKVATAKL